MSHAEPLKKKADYYSIKEGSFRLPTNEANPEAIHREYTNPKTKVSGVAHELGFKSLTGVIKDIRFMENTLKDGTTLRSINIELDENGQGVAQIISIPIDSRYTSDFLKKLPAIKLNEEVRLAPYDFEPKEGPRQVGISVSHKDESGDFKNKVLDFFVEKKETKDGVKYVSRHGFPEPTDEDSQDWPFYFKKVNKFLVNYAKENVCPSLKESAAQDEYASQDKAIGDAIKNEPTKDDIPF